MLVKLTCSKPTTSRRDKEAETIIQHQLSDTSLVVSQMLFKDKNNPVRRCINDAGEVYSYHTAHTLPWADRGPRMLPVDQYDAYSTEMRRLVNNVESSVARLMPLYDNLVQADIAQRGARAAISDYPTAEEFKQKMAFHFLFSPLPDASHFLFDVSDEDKAALTQQIEDAEKQAKLDVAARIHDPLMHLVRKLSVPIGTDGAIFRDSAITNVTEACDIVAQLAMGDESVLAVVAEVKASMRAIVTAPSTVREQPAAREAAAASLKAVADRMSFLFAN